MDHAGDITESGGGLHESVHGLARRDVDRGGADVEAGVGEDVGGRLGVLLSQVGELHLLACADASGDGLADLPGSDDDDDFAHVASLSCRRLPRQMPWMNPRLRQGKRAIYRTMALEVVGLAAGTAIISVAVGLSEDSVGWGFAGAFIFGFGIIASLAVLAFGGHLRNTASLYGKAVRRSFPGGGELNRMTSTWRMGAVRARSLNKTDFGTVEYSDPGEQVSRMLCVAKQEGVIP